MTTLQTAAQQALEALEEYQSKGTPFLACDGAVAALRAALAKDEPVQEPVAWSGYDLDGMVEALSRVVEAHYHRANPFQNPIDMDAQMALRILRGFIPAMKAYTAPPQRKPLTDEEILKAIGWERAEMYMKLTPNFPVAEAKKETLKNARAIERAHGIGEAK